MKKIEVLVFCLILFSILAVYVLASDFNCTIVTNTSCTGGNNISVLYMENDSGGYYNAHAQNISVATASRYNYALCCDVTGDIITTSCQDSIFLRLSNETNAHIQQPSINTYGYPACMSATTGTVSCTYGTSCSSGRACIASMASSESADANQTNAHIGPCNEYTMKICCGLNSPPNITTLILNSTFGTNKTTENLTAYTTSSDADGDSVRLIYNWYRNNISLTVLNTPFESGSSNSTWTKDYALGNNGSVNGAIFKSTGGWNSTGAYEFDGTNDYINVSLNQVSPITIALWVKFNQTVNKSIIVYTTGNPTTTLGNQLRTKDSKAEAYSNDGSAKNATGTTTLLTGVWYHIAMTASNNDYLKLYVNGNEESSTSIGVLWSFGNSYLIGSNSGNSKGYFNGTLDEILIFNRSLSAEQIRALFNNKTDRIVAEETTKNEIWRVDATPNDGVQEGDMKSSNNLTILNSVPNVTLNLPLDNNLTTNRTPTFSWTGSDDDNDGITYTFNLTCHSTSGPGCSVDNREYTGSSTSYTLTSDLKYFQDNGYYYNWTVKAYDGESYSSWAAQRRIDIKALIDVFLVNDTVEFGDMGKDESKNTTTGNPPPLVIRNNGNSFINISANATSLWNTDPSPTINYRFKIDNKTTEPGAFNWLRSLISWTDMPPTTTMAIVELNYSDDRDEAEIDLLVRVPENEAPGYRSSIINFTASLGE